MKYKHFKKIIELHKKIQSDFSDLYDIGFDFYENKKFPIAENVENMLDMVLSNSFTKDGVDWISWFIYENDYGDKPGTDESLPNGYNAYDDSSGEKEYICYDMKSLYQYLKKYKYIMSGRIYNSGINPKCKKCDSDMFTSQQRNFNGAKCKNEKCDGGVC